MMRWLGLVGKALVVALAVCGAVALAAEARGRWRDRQAIAVPAGTAKPPAVRLVPARTALLEGQALLDALRGGGYVVYFRHFHSDHRKWHNDPIRDKHDTMSVAEFQASCDQQRPLSAYGLMRARDAGAALKALGIPVGEVLASPYCRVIESAKLVTGRDPEPRLELLTSGGKRTRNQSVADLRPWLAAAPAPGTNRLLFSHRPQMDDIEVLAEGQAFVFRPLGDGTFEMVGSIHDTDWIEALHDPRYFGARAVNEALEDPIQKGK